MTSNLTIIPSFIPDPDTLFTEIMSKVTWDERMKARKTASFGVSYDYSGITYPQVDMLPCLNDICDKIETTIGFRPNNCLMNYYTDGNSSMGYHSDSTEELLKGTGVAIVSLGATRAISYRSKADKNIKVRYDLKSGTLLYMDDKVQKDWMHAIPKEGGVGERISLTKSHNVNIIYISSVYKD